MPRDPLKPLTCFSVTQIDRFFLEMTNRYAKDTLRLFADVGCLVAV